MKHLKKFDELNEGKGRIKIKDNMVVAGDVNLPQFWTTSPDYKDVDHTKNIQPTGVNVKDMIAPVGNDYTYLTDTDDHIDSEEVRKLVEPHVKKFNDFGISPSETKKK